MNMTQEELQQLLTSFEQEVGHITESKIDQINHLKSISVIGAKATSSKLKPKDIVGMKTSIEILVWRWDKKNETKLEFIGEFPSVTHANNQLGTTGDSLSRVARGQCKQAKGYYAEFKNN